MHQIMGLRGSSDAGLEVLRYDNGAWSFYCKLSFIQNDIYFTAVSSVIIDLFMILDLLVNFRLTYYDKQGD